MSTSQSHEEAHRKYRRDLERRLNNDERFQRELKDAQERAKRPRSTER